MPPDVPADLPACPDCGGGSCLPVGPIPAAYRFCGVRLEDPLPESLLVRCRECHLQFKHPCLDQSSLAKLYREVPGDYWSSNAAGRNDFVLVREQVRNHCAIGVSVLDVGCGSGDFLEFLGPEFRRFGIEINPEALAIATRRGIEPIGSDFSEIGATQMKFDVIVAVDVLEHVPSPRAFIARCVEHLGPRGVLILSTGNTSAPSWKLMRGGYWYCHEPAHIAFVNPEWIRKLCEETGLQTLECRRFSHARSSLPKLCREWTSNLAYRFVPGARRFVQAIKHRVRDRRRLDEISGPPPSFSQAADHMVVALRRPDVAHARGS